jgi:CRP-like cAMP-binding protein
MLERLPLLGQLNRSALDRLASMVEEVRLARGETLFRRGDAAAFGYLVLDGVIELSRDGVRGATQANSGTLIGELSLFAATRRPVTAVCVQPCHLARFSRDSFHRILQEFPGEAERLRAVLAARADEFSRSLATFRADVANHANSTVTGT